MNLCERNRVIYRQGYLKKAPKAGKFGASFKKWDKRWFVFGTLTGSAFLEYYETDSGPGRVPPINTIWLGTCQFVTVNMMEQKYDNAFTIGMMDRVLNLVAPDLGEMHAWIECLQGNLTKLGILHGKENLYDEHPKKSQSFARQTSVDKQCKEEKHGLEVNLDSANCNQKTNKFTFDGVEATGGGEERGMGGEAGGMGGDVGGIGVIEYEPDESGGKTPLKVMVEFDIDETGRKIPIRDPRSPLPPTPTVMSPNQQIAAPSSGNLYPRSPLPPTPTGISPNQQIAAPPSGNLINLDDYESPITTSPAEVAPPIPSPGIESDTYGATWNPINGNRPLPAPSRPLQRTNSRPIKLVDPTTPPPLPSSRKSSRSSNEFYPRSPEISPGYNNGPISPRLPVDPSFDPLPAASTFDPEAMKNVMATAIGANKNLTHDAILEFAKSTSDIDGRVNGNNVIQRQNSRGGLTDQMGNMTLKEREVYQLKQEISHPGGVKVSLRKKDCHHTLALVEMLDGVWIAGWNQKARPFLHSAFHIGDQVVSVNGFHVTRSKDIPRVLDSSRDDVKVEFIVKRTPFAKVFAVKRSAEGENLGFKREGGTAEIGFVNLAGLAAKHGLSAKAQTLDGTNFCTWIITEVNNRPLNLFFKDNEIEYRLNAVGRDISFMVQPKDFIKLLKKHLKQLKGYKDFIVQ